MAPEVPTEQKKRVFHPYLCRLRQNAQFKTTSLSALVGSGFASFIVGIFSCFRLTPFFLLSLVTRIDITSRRLDMYKIIFLVSISVWLIILGIIFFLFGFLQIVSVKTKKRCLALLHPWGLLFIYFDIVFWLILTVVLHYEIIRLEARNEITFHGINPPMAFFFLIYVDLFFFWIIYWTYATYFIVAELTVIEKFL